jgi:PBSX family phage terminase large subunit
MLSSEPYPNTQTPTIAAWSRRPLGLEALRAAAELAPDLRALLPVGSLYTVAYEPRGAAATLQQALDPEVLVSGPAGTGKSRACLEKLHRAALRWPGMKGLIVRKTRESLSDAALMTFEEKVLPAGSTLAYGAQRRMRQAYVYPNGSEIAIGGIDKASKVMSTERDLIYIQEATELDENDWEYLTTRLRNGKTPAQQLIADCNPDRPTHWLKARCDAGRCRMLESRHEDNPLLWDGDDWTEAGRGYIARLDALTGARRERLRFGRWAAAEGLVYEGWDRAAHVVSSVVSANWTRYWSVDFGFTNAFVWQQWATDPDGRLYLEKEIYRTQTLVEDHCKAIKRVAAGVKPRAVICDHDAEGRATLERHLGVTTTPAYKDIPEGIQAVQARLRTAGDGRPRLFICEGALVDRDEALVEAKKPVGTVDEFDAYVWAKAADGRPNKEQPVDDANHGLDALRYLTCYVDNIGVAKARFFL